MSSLDFLSPDRARSDLGFTPVLKSSMERRAREAGARFEERDRWLLPVSFPDEEKYLAQAGIGDLSHLGKLEARGNVPETVVGETVWHRVTQSKAIVLCPFPQTAAIRARLGEAGADVLDVTAALAVLALVGPKARTVLARMTHLHTFPASGDISHVSGHVIPRADGYWIVFPQEYGHYLWEVAVDAAEPLGGGPVGVDAMGGLG